MALLLRRTPELVKEIFDRLSGGETLRQICKDKHIPSHQAVMQWCDSDPDFACQYARRRSEGLDVIAQEMLDIADDKTDEPNSRRVRVDTRKWLLSKLKPGTYGDLSRIEHEVGPELSKKFTGSMADLLSLYRDMTVKPEDK